MKIIVLVKVVPDPDGIYALDSEGNVLSDELPRLVSVFDENAVEAGVQLREDHGARVTALCYGRPDGDKTLIQALAIGADEAVLIEDPESATRGSHTVAAVLTAAIRKLGGADLIIAGRESSDVGNGLVGPLVAQLLGIPFLTLVVKIDVVGGEFRLARLAEGGYDVFGATPPVLLTVSNQLNYPRYPSVMNFLQAKKKPMQRWPVAELGIDLDPAADHQLRLLRRYQPIVLGDCHFAEGETPRDRVSHFVRMLRAERLV